MRYYTATLVAHHMVVVVAEQVAVATLQMMTKKTDVVVGMIMAINMGKMAVAVASTTLMVADVVDHTNYIAKSRASIVAP